MLSALGEAVIRRRRPFFQTGTTTTPPTTPLGSSLDILWAAPPTQQIPPLIEPAQEPDDSAVGWTQNHARKNESVCQFSFPWMLRLLCECDSCGLTEREWRGTELMAGFSCHSATLIGWFSCNIQKLIELLAFNGVVFFVCRSFWGFIYLIDALIQRGLKAWGAVRG